MKRVLLAMAVLLAWPTAARAQAVKLWDTKFFGGAISGSLGLPNGTCSAVALGFTADASNTGWVRPGTDSWGFCDNGTERIRISTGGRYSTIGDFALGSSLAGVDLILQREATGTFQLGQDVNGAATAQTIKAHDGITGTDVAGANLTVASGRGTGAAAATSLFFQTPTPIGSGTTAQTLATRLSINGTSITSTLPMILPAADPTGSTLPITFGDADSGFGNAADTATNIGIYVNGAEKFRCDTSGVSSCYMFAGLNIGTSDLALGRESAGTLQVGLDVNGAPTPIVVKAADGITGTDIAGSSLTLAGGRGTGAGAAADLVLQTSTALATGTTAQTLVARHHIEGSLRALTDATATTVFTVTTGNDLSCGGTMFFTVEAADAANQQATSGSVNFSAVDNAAGDGGEACAAAVTGTNAAAATSGTLTVTADAVDGGADLCNIRLTATGSLTETVGPRVRYSIVFNPTSSTCAVTPQ